MLRAELLRHPVTPTSPVRAIDVQLARGNDRLAVTFTITGALDGVRVPAAVAPRRGDRLWEHTCCEAFIATDDDTYCELNFSPSGEWAGYAFRGYRDRSGDTADAVELPLRVERGSDRLIVAAQITLSRLSPRYPTAALRVGCSAVIEAGDGTISYWALHHGPGGPDFHCAAAFALTLEAPRRE